MPTRTRRDISFDKASRRVPSGGLLAFGDGGAVVGAGAVLTTAAAFGDGGARDIVQGSLSTPHWMTRRERGLLMATTSTSGSNPEKPKTGRSLTVRQAAARAAVTASKKTGRPVDERVRKIANSQ